MSIKLQKLRKLQKPQMQGMVWTADLRERNAERAQNSANSSDSEWLLAPDVECNLPKLSSLIASSYQSPVFSLIPKRKQFCVGDGVVVGGRQLRFLWRQWRRHWQSKCGPKGLPLVVNVAVDAVEKRGFLSHLQHLVIVKVRWDTPNPNPSPIATGEGRKTISLQSS